MGTILELNGIKKYYGKKEVLKGIGIQVEEGQVISVLGSIRLPGNPHC